MRASKAGEVLRLVSGQELASRRPKSLCSSRAAVHQLQACLRHLEQYSEAHDYHLPRAEGLSTCITQGRVNLIKLA